MKLVLLQFPPTEENMTRNAYCQGCTDYLVCPWHDVSEEQDTKGIPVYIEDDERTLVLPFPGESMAEVVSK